VQTFPSKCWTHYCHLHPRPAQSTWLRQRCITKSQKKLLFLVIEYQSSSPSAYSITSTMSSFGDKVHTYKRRQFEILFPFHYEQGLLYTATWRCLLIAKINHTFNSTTDTQKAFQVTPRTKSEGVMTLRAPRRRKSTWNNAISEDRKMLRPAEPYLYRWWCRWRFQSYGMKSRRFARRY